MNGRTLLFLGSLAFAPLAPAWADAPPARSDVPPLKKEPEYASDHPRYGILAFGPERKIRVWAILDGSHSLYLDRNGNGDLTEDREYIPVLVNKQMDSPWVAAGYHFTDRKDPFGRLSGEGGTSEGRNVPTISTTDRYQRFNVNVFARNDKFVPKTDADRAGVASFQQHWDGFVLVIITVDGRHTLEARARFSATPAEAPQIDFDAPMAFELAEPDLVLKPGEKNRMLCQVATRGKNATTLLAYSQIPKDVAPKAEVEFSTGERTTIRQTVLLRKRGGGAFFYEFLNVPKDAHGTAKATLSWPDVVGLEIEPATIEIPVAPAGTEKRDGATASER